MPRCLSVHRATVPLGERSRYMERLTLRKTHYTSNGCRYWVFEEAGLPGAFLEFTEAADDKTLLTAHSKWPDRIADGSRIYREVELT